MEHVDIENVAKLVKAIIAEDDRKLMYYAHKLGITVSGLINAMCAYINNDISERSLMHQIFNAIDRTKPEKEEDENDAE